MKRQYLVVMLLLASGCSNRAIYEGIQAGNRNDCARLPPSQYDACMENASKTYDEYRREREEVMGD